MSLESRQELVFDKAQQGFIHATAGIFAGLNATAELAEQSIRPVLHTPETLGIRAQSLCFQVAFDRGEKSVEFDECARRRRGIH